MDAYIVEITVRIEVALDVEGLDYEASHNAVSTINFLGKTLTVFLILLRFLASAVRPPRGFGGDGVMCRHDR